ncbi:DNA-directed RNA polymerase II subunit RPB4 [Cyberlindnera fabianii]|uniref:DNA-directed RNA polymerase II subunit RPB4 n=1 Tax=Cyberlindnera fabianii TaxID=36022 RepID=A0A1V2L4S3_CYBFA|nr:DNA-directed RNA polymerase II subunit RPB4 [Cyberlindnera fabianii]
MNVSTSTSGVRRRTAAQSNEEEENAAMLQLGSEFAVKQNVLKAPENGNLHPFEIAQLGSLACDDVDEAKTLIPSLVGKKTDEELQSILNQLSRLETPY